jgi:hypothetical protein
MMSIRCTRRVALAAVGTALLLAAGAITPVRSDGNGKQEGGEGKYADLTAVWWQWALGQPAVDVDGTNTNPVLDSTGEFAAAGQPNGIGPANKYFFLAGTFGGDVTRVVTVPKGKTLFFPVVNFEADNAVAPPTNYTVPQLRALAAAQIDSVTSAFAELDGAPLQLFRTKSPTFAYTLPAENSIYEYFGLIGPQFEGTVKPAVSDGYWAVIPPLPPGEYLLQFGGANSSGFSNEVTYYLTVP